MTSARTSAIRSKCYNLQWLGRKVLLKPAAWDSHATKPLRKHSAFTIKDGCLPFPPSNTLLKSCYGKGFHDSLGRLGLDLHILSKDVANSSLGSRLHACLDHAHARENELAH